MTPPLVFGADGGLANRLRAYVGMRVLATIRGEHLFVAWPKNGACHAHFDELFEPPSNDRVSFLTETEAREPRYRESATYHYTSAWFVDLWREFASTTCSYEEFCRRSLSELRGLRPAAPLRDKLSTFEQQHAMRQAIGLHVRMTDNLHVHEWWRTHDPGFDDRAVSQLEGFEKWLTSPAAQNALVFLATDNRRVDLRLRKLARRIATLDKRFSAQGLAHHLRTTYGKRDPIGGLASGVRTLLRLPPPVSWRTSSVADAVVELFLLAKCKKIIGTYYSSFGQVAALIGGVPLAVMCGTTLRDDDFVDSLNRLASAHRTEPVQ